MLIQYIVFWKTNPSAVFKESMINLRSINIDNIYLKDLEIQDEREYILVNVQMKVKPRTNYSSDDGWMEVTTRDLKRVISEANKFGNKWLNVKRIKAKGLKLIGNYLKNNFSLENLKNDNTY